MPRLLRYLTHPQVKIDPDVPVPEWGLSELGRKRAERFASLPMLAGTTGIVSSAETKAIETADIVSAAISTPYQIREKTHENDRSATGFLNPDEFEQVVDQFFNKPAQSVRGWERAIDAQARIVAEAEVIIGAHARGDLLMVGHGAVGTLLLCHLAGWSISREHDQPPGGGHMFAYDLEAGSVLHGWRSIEVLTDACGN